jgi:SAM-dependent methyltransferase
VSASPLAVYAAGLRTAVSDSGVTVTVRLSDGTLAPLALERYLGGVEPADETALAGVRGPVLDVGCGPGRHLQALARRGVFGLGVDLSSVAVALAREGGARAIVASIFDELPGAGEWHTALLLDGNIGIGGSPERLLRRIGALLTGDGELVVELDRPEVRSGALRARLETAVTTSAWFPWAQVAYNDIDPVARAAGFGVARRWSSGDRFFASLRLRRPLG